MLNLHKYGIVSFVQNILIVVMIEEIKEKNSNMN